jgi:pilus assembly protein CpaB
MNRRTRTLVVLAIALGMATVVSFAVYQAVQRVPVREVEVTSYQVVVAAHPLSMGTRLAASDVKVVAWPSKSPIAKAHSDVKDVLNRGLLSAVAENEPLTEGKLASLEAGAGLPPVIPPGMRAMSVKVNEVVGVAGFVVPGTKVDVIVTLRRQDDPLTRTVASNVQVLTAGTRYDQEKAKDGQPIPSTVVTLMVSPEDAERITLAQEQGQLMLALRNPLDTEQAPTNGVRIAGLFGTPAPEPVKAKAVHHVSAMPPPAPVIVIAPKPYTVEAIRAAKRSEEVIR